MLQLICYPGYHYPITKKETGFLPVSLYYNITSNQATPFNFFIDAVNFGTTSKASPTMP